MKLFKRVTGLTLALLMLVGMLPMSAAAETVTYTSMDARVYNAHAGAKVSDAQLNLKFATDEMGEIHQPDDSVQVNGKWYHTVNDLETVPDEQKSNYTLHTFNVSEMYAREVNTDETFIIDEQYIYVVELTPTNGQFAPDCLYSPSNEMEASITSTKATLFIYIMPMEERSIGWINFTCSKNGNITITDSNPSYIYLYEVDDGNTIVDNLTGEPIGKYTLNTAECAEIAANINVFNNPRVTLYAVSYDEWAFERTCKVLAYGTYTIPMSDPYISVDTLKFGDYISVTEIGTQTGGKYSWKTASANFEGWFIDKEGKVPALNESDAYAIFTLRSYGLFDPNICAEDFVLKSGYERYSGSYLFPQTAANTQKIAFFVPSNRISVTLEVVGDGASMSFINSPGTPTIALRPLASGKYEAQDIYISVEPGYYVKALKVNGEVWDDLRNPFTPTTNLKIMNDVPYEAGIPSFEPTESTVITLEVAPADRITIDYGNNMPAYTGRYADENKWHINGQYWVSEASSTELCSVSAILDSAYTQHLKELNTKPDGTGISVPKNSTHFYWEPIAEFQNGERDEITLYAIMECDAHVQYGVADNQWEYLTEQKSSCTETGYIAHRYCPVCHQHQVISEETGEYVSVGANEVIIEKLPHDHTVYLNVENGNHTVKCANCDDSYTEAHEFTNGLCKCGYRVYVKGDINEDGYVTDADAVYLLYHTIFAEEYPIVQPADFNNDGYVTDADAVYLLYYTIFPEDYPLN